MSSRTHFAMVTCRWSRRPTSRGTATSLARKRTTIRHSARNGTVRALASAASRPRELLARLGLDPGVPALPDQVHPVVLVESTAHARSLVRLLPGWTVRDAVPESLRRAYTLSDSEADIGPGNIVTLVALSVSDDIAADVVIRATGGRDAVHWDRFRDGSGRFGGPHLLVDLHDLGDKIAEKDSIHRRRGYAGDRLVPLAPTHLGLAAAGN